MGYFMRLRHHCRLHVLLKLIFLIVLTAWGGIVFAVDYYWRGSNLAHTQITGQTPIAACEAISSTVLYPSNDPVEVVFTSSTTANCKYYFWTNSSRTTKASSTVGLVREGTSCPPDATYNPTTGACDVPAEEAGTVCGDVSPTYALPKIIDSSGQCVEFPLADTAASCKYLGNNAGTVTQRVFVRHDGDGVPQKPEAEDAIGCELEITDVTHCKLPPPKTNSSGVYLPPNGVYCEVGVSYTGEVAGGDDGSGYVPIGDPDALEEGVCPPGEECEPNELPIENTEKPCTYVQDAEGRMVCSSSKYTGKPGEVNCGTVNGSFECITKQPTSNGISVGTVVEETSNPDGTTTTKKTDTIKQTICTGQNACTTSTTTNVTNTTKDGGGNVLDKNGSCVGAACSDGKGDSDGDGLKDCAVGSTCEGEDEEIGGQNWFSPGEDTYETVFASFKSRVQAAPAISAAQGFFVFAPGGSCPTWNASAWVFDIQLDQHCSVEIPWEAIRAIILALAGFVAFRWAFL